MKAMKDRIIRKLVIPEVDNAMIQYENDMPKVMKSKRIYGRFIKLEDIQEYYLKAPEEIYENLVNKLAEKGYIEIYEREIHKLKVVIQELKAELWRKKNWLSLFVSFGLYEFWNPYREEANVS